MNRASTTAHSTHDELLIARLYGRDLDERERTRAHAQMAECDACADLFADFGAIAAATADLPTPTRPRDFSLTEADAARLGRPRRSFSVSFGRGWARTLGGSFVAAGFAGLALVGAITMFSPRSAATTSAITAESNQGDRGAAAGSGALDVSGSAEGPAAPASYPSTAPAASPTAAAASAGSSQPGGVAFASAAPTTSEDQANMAAATIAPEYSSGSVYNMSGSTASATPPNAAPSAASAGSEGAGQGLPAPATPGGTAPSQPDLSRLVVAVSGALLVLGLVMLVAARRRGSRRADG
jgi:hypothetical protein